MRKWLKNTKAAIGPRSAMLIGIALFVVAIVFPMAMTEITGTNTTGWNSGVTTTFQTLLPVLGVIAIALGFLKGRR